MLEGAYISKQGLKGLDAYKYHGSDKSIVANYVMQPFWTRAVNLLPRTMAPNLVTLTGFMFIIASYLLTLYYVPNLTGPAPSWVYWVCGINLFIYQTLDALDGKQARRTGTSSPLGELFDHGCDAATTVLTALTIGAAIQIGTNWVLYSFVVVCLVTFYSKQWEEYHTGSLDLGYMNVTEAQLTTIFSFFLSGFFGPDWWFTEVNVFGYTLTYQYIALSSCYLGGFFTTLESLVITLKLDVTNIRNLLPVITSVTFFHLWQLKSPALISTHPHPLFLGVGFMFAGLVGRIVLDRVCKQHFSPMQPLALLPIFGFANAYFKYPIPETLYVYLFALVAIGAYLHFALSVIHDICKHLKIKCLSIPPPKRI